METTANSLQTVQTFKRSKQTMHDDLRSSVVESRPSSLHSSSWPIRQNSLIMRLKQHAGHEVHSCQTGDVCSGVSFQSDSFCTKPQNLGLDPARLVPTRPCPTQSIMGIWHLGPESIGPLESGWDLTRSAGESQASIDGSFRNKSL